MKIETMFVHEKEAATYLNMSLQWMRKQRSEGKAPGHYKFGSAVRYRIDELDEYIKSSKRQFTGQHKL